MKPKPVLRSLIAMFALVFCAAAFAQAQAGRAALVIGNSAYKASPLTNPVNDATDIAASLKEAGFDVLLRSDQDLAGMEGSLAEFQTLLKGKDTALFYYAGHGVQVDGENFLIPVKEVINTPAQAKSRSVSLGDLLDRVKASGVKTALVFLDACRDNPFPGASSRGGPRGLAVIAAPADVETCIAYATQPGSTAADGTGRNGVFTTAMLKNLGTPGASLSDLMTSVMADVKATTSGKQQPRVDNGLTKPFYFIDPAVASARSQAALDKSKAELAGLDSKLADLQKQIASASDSQAKQKLQVEQQRQQALQAGKKLESENLAKDAERQRQSAVAAAQLASQKSAAQAAARQEQGALADLAASRRAELDKLAKDGASDNPDVLIETVERLEAVLKEVDGQYAAALQKSLTAANSTWDKQLASMSGEQPDITETDADFAARISKTKADLESKRRSEIAGMRASAESQRLGQTATIRKQYDDTLRTLQTKVWTLQGSAVALSVGAFDRNARTWPFTVDSTDPAIPMLPVALVAELGKVADPVAAIRSLDAAVKANALAAEIDWGITRDAANKRYNVDIRAVRVINLSTNTAVVGSTPGQRAAYFVAGPRSTPFQPGFGSLKVVASAGVGDGDVYVEGKKLGTTPLTIKLATGTVQVQVRWADPYESFSRQVTIGEGKVATVSATKTELKFGGIGPAGGIVFYDKGSVSDGWRYLEAAPYDQSSGIQWYNGYYIDIKTGTAVGSGKANTDAIIAAQGNGSYAASLCKNLTLGGYSDWFLPSKDELDLMYKNLKTKGSGGFGEGWLWSSSQDDINVAWFQGFSVGGQYDGFKYTSYAVRACRAF